MAMLDGKVAIVTGSARGIGRATAALLAEQGARVVINDLDRELANRASGEIAGDTLVRAGDLAESDPPADYSPLTMRIRHADPARDAAACATVYAPFVESSATSFEEVAPDAAEFARRIERLAGSHAFLVVEDEQGVAGFAYGSPHRERAAYRWTAEVSIYLDGRAQGRGVGSAVYGELLALLEAQGVCLALAGIALPNPPSVALHKACGFEPVGVYRGVGFKAGTWHDVGWWQRRLRPDDGAPAELGPPARLHQTPRHSSSSSSASVGQESAARRASPISSGGTASVSRIG